MTSDLEEIARRVEAATGPDRALDAAIDRLFNDRPKNGDYVESEGAFWRVSEPWRGLLVRPDGFARGSFCAAGYTASLDAAMTLVPENADWSVDFWVNDKPGASVNCRWPHGGFRSDACVYAPAATSALALTAAALKARAHLGGNDAR